MKTSCCHTNVRMKMQVKLIGSAIQQCWHSCTWKNKSYGINCSMLIYQSLILKRHNQDWIRQAHFLLIMCVEISNILCSVLFSPEAARKFWLQVMILRGYVTTIKQDPTVFRWNFIDLDRKRRKQKKNHISKGFDYQNKLNCHVTFFHMYKNLQYRTEQPRLFLCVHFTHSSHNYISTAHPNSESMTEIEEAGATH